MTISVEGTLILAVPILGKSLWMMELWEDTSALMSGVERRLPC